MSTPHFIAHLPEFLFTTDNILFWSSSFQVSLTSLRLTERKQPLFLPNSLLLNVYRYLSGTISFFYLKQGSQSFLKFANTILGRVHLCSLGDFYELTLALVFTMGTNSRRVRAKFLEPEDCALDQALYVAQRHTQNAAETQQPKPDDSHPTAGSISIGCSSFVVHVVVHVYQYYSR